MKFNVLLIKFYEHVNFINFHEKFTLNFMYMHTNILFSYKYIKFNVMSHTHTHEIKFKLYNLKVNKI